MKKNYSYVSLLTNDSYSYGIVLLVESMKKVNTKYPLHVLVTDNVSDAVLELLNQLENVTYEKVDTIPITDYIYVHNEKINAPLAVTWKNCWTKFRIFNLTQFDKIVFLDADIMVMKNLDHLFEKPHMTAALDGEYFNLWPGWDHFNSGCLVIEPKEEEFNNILTYANSLREEDLPNYVFADQELLNFYYKDWPEKKELHLNKYYNIFPPYVQNEDIDELTKECYFMHYVGRKPWTFWIKNPNETYAEVYYTIGKQFVETGIRALDWRKIRSHLVLTVYAICKDERANVERWMNSFGLADNVCVLDTGSTDGTWEWLQEEAKKRNNLIISQETVVPWRYDKARNISMTLIPKNTDIFFMADLDEEIKELDWVEKVKNCWDPLFSRGMYDYNRDVDENGNIIRTIKEYRLHSKEWTHWVNIVHEAICKEDGEKRFYMEACNKAPIVVWHYSKNRENNYMELCEEDLKEYPDDWIMRLQLAIEYEIRNESEKAIEHYKYILSHENNLQNFEIARCFNGLGRYAHHNNNLKSAIQCFREGRIACDFFADNYLEAMEMYYNNNNFAQVIELGKAAIQNCREAQWCGNYDINNYYVYYLLGLAYWQLEDYWKALGYVQYAYAKNPNENIKKQLNNFMILINQKMDKKEKIKL